MSFIFASNKGNGFLCHFKDSLIPLFSKNGDGKKEFTGELNPAKVRQVSWLTSGKERQTRKKQKDKEI